MSHPSETPDESQVPASVPPTAASASEKPATEDEASQPRWLRTPPIDIFETDEGLVLRADLPGVTPETLELQVQDNRLTLFGRSQTDLPDEERLVHQEYRVGDFLRSFILSDDVDHDRISAKLVDGVLELNLPRVPKAIPRKIPIQTE